MDEELVTIVEQYPQLYDLSHKGYDNNLVKDNIWKEIDGKLQKPYDECRNKWGLLRFYFLRARARRKTTTGQAAKKIKKWRLEEQMQFLIPFLHSRETYSNVENPLETDTSDVTEHVDEEDLSFCTQFSPNTIFVTPSPVSSVQSASSRSGRKRDRQRMVPSTDTDFTSNLDAALSQFINVRSAPPALPQVSEKKKKFMNFFEDIAETMTTFSDIDTALIKKQIFNIVNKKEIENLDAHKSEKRNYSQLTGFTPINYESNSSEYNYLIHNTEIYLN